MLTRLTPNPVRGNAPARTERDCTPADDDGGDVVGTFNALVLACNAGDFRRARRLTAAMRGFGWSIVPLGARKGARS